MTHKTEDDKGEEEEGDGEIYHDAIREEGRTEENSGLEENVKMRSVQKLNFSVVAHVVFKCLRMRLIAQFFSNTYFLYSIIKHGVD